MNAIVAGSLAEDVWDSDHVLNTQQARVSSSSSCLLVLVLFRASL